MPTIRVSTGATTSDLLSNVKFADIPESGAIINVWGSCAVAGGTFGLSIGDRDIVVQGTEVNVEESADVINTERDQLVFQEAVPGGHLYLPIGAAGTESQYLIHIRYL